MFGPTAVLVGTSLVLGSAIRILPESALAMQLWKFAMHIVLGRTASFGCAALASIGPIVVIFSLWRAIVQKALGVRRATGFIASGPTPGS
jgi:hypothetical protein